MLEDAAILPSHSRRPLGSAAILDSSCPGMYSLQSLEGQVLNTLPEMHSCKGVASVQSRSVCALWTKWENYLRAPGAVLFGIAQQPDKERIVKELNSLYVETPHLKS